MALKDAAGLVKMYAMVNVSQYQIVATGSDVAECEGNYRQMLARNNLIDNSDANIPADTQEATGVLTDIRTAVIDGNSRYYLRLQGGSVYYVLSAADAPQVVTLNTGDRVTITYRPQEDASILEATAVTLVSGSSGTVDNPTDPIKINPAPGIGDIITDPGDGGRVELPVEPPPEEAPAVRNRNCPKKSPAQCAGDLLTIFFHFPLTLNRAVGRLPSSSRMHRRRSSPMFSGMPDSIQSNTPLSRPRA